MEAGDKIKIDVDLFWIGLVLLIIMFYGEPDLHDAIIWRLMH